MKLLPTDDKLIEKAIDKLVTAEDASSCSGYWILNRKKCYEPGEVIPMEDIPWVGSTNPHKMKPKKFFAQSTRDMYSKINKNIEHQVYPNYYYLVKVEYGLGVSDPVTVISCDKL